jgi:hypothetical protein
LLYDTYPAADRVIEDHIRGGRCTVLSGWLVMRKTKQTSQPRVSATTRVRVEARAVIPLIIAVEGGRMMTESPGVSAGVIDMIGRSGPEDG